MSDRQVTLVLHLHCANIQRETGELVIHERDRNIISAPAVYPVQKHKQWHLEPEYRVQTQLRLQTPNLQEDNYIMNVVHECSLYIPAAAVVVIKYLIILSSLKPTVFIHFVAESMFVKMAQQLNGEVMFTLRLKDIAMVGAGTQEK